jgi:aminobenzoyl-glutamate utilization protein B
MPFLEVDVRRKQALILFCVLLDLSLAQSSGLSAKTDPEERAALLQKMDDRTQHFGELSRQIWELAELGYKEIKSSDLLKSELRSAGFQIQDNVAEIPTAFIASWGQGKPVIGILGEYDALPGLSQDDVPEKKPRLAGGPGHGCGHNLLGAASTFAAIVVKEYLAEHRIPGIIRFYGTPAEEGGGGKVYMVRAGAFRDCDAVLTWHPSDENRIGSSSLATIFAKFRFYGKASHAAIAPEKGRSALDALTLMNHAVDLMREHVPEPTRLHYIITQGGSAPNIVPDFAEGYFGARHPDMATLDGIWERVVKCAEAGVLATETRMEMEIISSYYNLLRNDALDRLLERNLRLVGGVHYSSEEQAFARALRNTLPAEQARPLGSEKQIHTEGATPVGSSDVGDVSWMVPTAHFDTATWVPGTPFHSWQSAACSGMSIGRKGMLVAAKTLALSAIDLFENPKEVEAARVSFQKSREGQEYRSRLPAGQKPPLNYRDR